MTETKADPEPVPQLLTAREMLETTKQRVKVIIREGIAEAAREGRSFLVVSCEGDRSRFPSEMELELCNMGYSVEYHIPCPEHPDNCAVVISWDGPLLARFKNRAEKEQPMMRNLMNMMPSEVTDTKPS